MTPLVVSLEFLPMALNTRTGIEVQRPLVPLVIGGLSNFYFFDINSSAGTL
jgi:Cu/Ag efflux pump CusA